MKDFLKFTLATVTGIILSSIVLFIVSMVTLFGIMSASDTETIVKKNSVMMLDLNGTLVERTQENPLDILSQLFSDDSNIYGLDDILSSIKKAKENENIKGIYLQASSLGTSYASLQEIRNALLDFKESGKFIYSYSNLGYSQKSYYLATVADKIFVNPETPLLLTGMSSSISFYKETLAKLGIQPEVVKVGKFKSAVEPFISDEMSPANREQVQKYLDSSWGTIVKGIAESRNIPVDSINALANRFDFYTTRQFQDFGFFDGVLYEDQMLALLKEKCGVGSSDPLNQIALTDYQNASVPEVPIEFNKDKIAVVYASGEIGLEQKNNTIGPELAKTIRKIREDNTVKAIVLRVNSPGGSALTSDIIWREVELATQTKPVIVSMGNVAASGGYYISCAADTIVAEPTTLTGSIGIFGMFFSGEKLIEDKMGIHTDVVKTNDHSDFGGSYPLPLPVSNRALTPYETAKLCQSGV